MGCGVSREPTGPQQQGRSSSVHPLDRSLEQIEGLKTVGSLGVSEFDKAGLLQTKQRTKKMQEFSIQLADIVSKEESEGTERDVIVGHLYDMMDEDHKERLSLQQLQRGFHRIGWAHSPKGLKAIFKMPKVGGWIDNENEFSVTRLRFIETFRGLRSLAMFRCSSRDSITEVLDKRRRKWDPGTRRLRGYTIEPLVSLSRRIKCISASPPLPCLAVCVKDACTAMLLSSETGETYRTFSGHCSAIFDLSISPDKRFVATASRDNTLILWDCTCGHLVKQFRHPGVVTCCVFTENNQILTGSYDSMVRRYDVGKGLMHTTPPQQSGKGVVITLATMKQMAAVTRTREMAVEIIHVKSMKGLMKLGGHDTVVWILQFNSTGSNLISLCEKYIKVWKTENMVIEEEAVGSVSIDDLGLVSGGIVSSPPHASCSSNANKLTFLSASFLPSSFEHLIMATTSPAVVSFFDISGVQLFSFPNRFPFYTITPCSDGSEKLYVGDTAGNIFTISVF